MRLFWVSIPCSILANRGNRLLVKMGNLWLNSYWRFTPSSWRSDIWIDIFTQSLRLTALIYLYDLLLYFLKQPRLSWNRYHAAYNFMRNILSRWCEKILKLTRCEFSHNCLFFCDCVLDLALIYLIHFLYLTDFALPKCTLSFLLHIILNESSSSFEHLTKSRLHLSPYFSSALCISDPFLPNMMLNKKLDAVSDILGELILIVKLLIDFS